MNDGRIPAEWHCDPNQSVFGKVRPRPMHVLCGSTSAALARCLLLAGD